MATEHNQVRHVALIGVGLIGGSIGLAAREKLAVERVVGYDADPSVRERALELGAITEAADSIEHAVAGADLIVLAVPVGALAAVADKALRSAGEDAVVTDVGSTKRAVGVAMKDSRFVGGHPIAGAETAGVEHARAELFEGATWFLTPTEVTTGVGLERLVRFIRGLGSETRAIDAGTHDRLLADTSHLPHVLANALVSRTAQSMKLPDGDSIVIGPSFRDLTRIAGANTNIWKDIYLANRDALIESIESIVERLNEFRDALLHESEGDIVRLNDQARVDKVSLEKELVGGEVCELRVSVPNEPGILAQITLALGRAGVNIVDMALYPAPDMSSGAVSLWVAGEDAAQRTEALIGELGFPVARA